MSYATQSIVYCVEHCLGAVLVGHHSQAGEIAGTEGVVAINLPKPGSHQATGWRYHWRELRYAWQLAKLAKQHRCQLVMIDSGTTHWFGLWAFNLHGIATVANFHNVYHPVGNPPSRLIARWVCWLDRLYFRHGLAAMVGNSPECIRQARWLAGRRALPTREYRSQFVADDFLPIAQSKPPSTPFRVMFAGRLEPAKGIYDVLDMAALLHAEHPALQVHFDICGTGGHLDSLRAAVVERQLQDKVSVHGRLDRASMLARYAAAHVVIVPTRSEFGEGMPQVCAEAVLAGRPVISSVLSNAVDVLGAALVCVAPENIRDYAKAIVRLQTNPAAYELARSACHAASLQFLDRSKGVGPTIGWAIGQVLHQRVAP